MYYSFVCTIIFSIIFFIIVILEKKKRPEIPAEIKQKIEDSTNIVVCVCGVTGSGKTTLSKKIIDYYNSIHDEECWYTDCDYYYFQKFNQNRQQFDKYIREKTRESIKKKKFHVIDGANYKAMKTNVWNRCDYIIYVNTSKYVRVYNVIKREFINWLFNIDNEIGSKSSIYNLFIDVFKNRDSILWNAAGYSYQQKTLEDDLRNYKKNSLKIYEKQTKKNNEKIKNGQTIKEPLKPATIIYSFNNSEEKSEEKSEEIIRISKKDKEELTKFLFEWQKSYEGMNIIFASIGASSFADGRATKDSDYDIYIVYDGYNDIVPVSDLKHVTTNKTYEIDIQGHERCQFEKAIEEYDEIPTLNLEGARANPEQLLIYKESDYELYTRKEKNLKKLRKEFSKKISQVVGAKPIPYKSSKARNKFGWDSNLKEFIPQIDEEYIKGMKCFYVAWKLTLYAIQLAKFNRIVDFEEPIEFWHKLKEIPKEVLHSNEGYDECFKKLLEMGYVEKFAEFKKLAPSK